MSYHHNLAAHSVTITINCNYGYHLHTHYLSEWTTSLLCSRTMEFLVQLRPVTSVKRTLTQTLLCESRQQQWIDFMRCQWGDVHYFWHLCLFRKWNSDPVSWLPGKGRVARASQTEGGFEVSFAKNFQNNFHPILHYPLPMCLLISAWLFSALIPL